MSDGVVIDLHEEDAPEVVGPERLDWLRELKPHVLFDSDVILAASSDDPPNYDGLPGIYFIIWRNRICYVGQAGCITTRLLQHQKQGKPLERVAVIVGLPLWAQTEVEHAYIQAWDMPWNSERRRSGSLRDLPDFVADLQGRNREAVMPRYLPLVAREQCRWKEWQLQILGRQQWEAEQAPSNDPARLSGLGIARSVVP